MFGLVCRHCNKEVALGSQTLLWLHEDTKDTWCDPMQYQFSPYYVVAEPILEESVLV